MAADANAAAIPAAAIAAPPGSSRPGANILVVASPDSPELSVLGKLPAGANIVGIGKPADLAQKLTADDFARVDILLNCGVGAKAGTKADLQELWPRLTGLRWLHSASAGLEHLLFDALVDGPVVLTNARGVYSHSLAEYALTCASYFAKDFPRLLRQKATGSWEAFDVEELRGKTLGVLGYGDIGQATARLARAFGMRVVAVRRRTELSAAERDEGVLAELFAPDRLLEFAAASDYVVAALPHTPQTHKMAGRAFFEAMKPNSVFINIGRGKTHDEEALAAALDRAAGGHLRGAGLDVFFEEPLPASSPLWALDNVFISPHNADRTKEFQFQSLELFVDNVRRYCSDRGGGGGDPCAALLNVCDKRGGY
jgi:phosphoglycerate dehydrogenase-like enzyme